MTAAFELLIFVSCSDLSSHERIGSVPQFSGTHLLSNENSIERSHSSASQGGPRGCWKWVIIRLPFSDLRIAHRSTDCGRAKSKRKIPMLGGPLRQVGVSFRRT